MTTVITYGTFDLMHRGHVRLLERAKALGDYLIVGVTSDNFDKERGKINVSQTLLERVENVKSTGLADKIIVEEYEGQKIDDIIKYNVDIFTVGSDWEGKFDYLNEYCKVVYLDRTKGVSSTEIRSDNNALTIGIIGNYNIAVKFARECNFVNGVTVSGVFLSDDRNKEMFDNNLIVDDLDKLIDKSDAIYISTQPNNHYAEIKLALQKNKHVLCESPITINTKQFNELLDLANRKKLILMDSIKTAHSIAYQRLLLLVKGGIIGDVISIDSICTSLKSANPISWDSSFDSWGPTALLPIFQIFGTQYEDISIFTKKEKDNDIFTKIAFKYHDSVASIKVGNGIKSEGELIISGTKGYAYVPAPWWKTEYFEIRYEDANENKKYYFKNDKRAVIIAAGFGSRLVPITLKRPKPLLEVNGIRIIDTLLDSLINIGIEEIYIIRGYKKEMFDELLIKYPNIKFIDNPYYETCNNISSVYLARDLLENSYICEADLYISNPNIIIKEQSNSNYLGIKVKETSDWALLTNDNIINGVSIGGINCYQLVGISYWTSENAKMLKQDLEKTFIKEEKHTIFWDEVPLKYAKEHYKLHIRECLKTDIVEIDTYEELKEIDSSYK